MPNGGSGVVHSGFNSASAGTARNRAKNGKSRRMGCNLNAGIVASIVCVGWLGWGGFRFVGFRFVLGLEFWFFERRLAADVAGQPALHLPMPVNGVLWL